MNPRQKRGLRWCDSAMAETSITVGVISNEASLETYFSAYKFSRITPAHPIAMQYTVADDHQNSPNPVRSVPQCDSDDTPAYYDE